MLLCKVLQGSASEVGAILAGKWGVKHTGAELDAMSEVAKSAKNRCGRAWFCAGVRDDLVHSSINLSRCHT